MQFRPVLALVVASGSGCAPSHLPEVPTPNPDHRMSPPELIGCPYTPADHGTIRYMVTLSFRVLPDGSVDPDGIEWLRGHRDTREESVVERAREIARRCVYRPAMLDGVPVEARVRKYFLFSR